MGSARAPPRLGHPNDYPVTAPAVPWHIWLLPLHGGEATRMTCGAISVLENAPPFAGSISAPWWLAHGHTDFTRDLDGHAHPRRSRQTEARRPDRPMMACWPTPTPTCPARRTRCHGGPQAASSADFDGGRIGPLRQLFAADSDLVFEPNYRASDNLGSAHQHAIYLDPGSARTAT